MKTAVFSLFFFLFIIQIGVGQTNKKLNDQEPIQTIVQYENPLAKADALAKFKSKNKLDKYNTYVPTYSNTDETGRKHEHFQQFHKGLKVEFGIIITHSRNNKVDMINGEVYNASNLNTTAFISADQALNVILNSKTNTQYLWEFPKDALAMDYKKPNGELLILPNIKTGAVNLAYKFDIYTTQPLARDEIYVDAQNGTILYSNPIIKHANEIVNKINTSEKSTVVSSSVTGTANNTKYSGSQLIKTTFDATTNKYVLRDDTRGNGIQTFNSARTNTYPSTDFSDSDNNWTTAEYNNTNKDIGALDAHWGAEMTYDFWKNIYNRNSYDDQGTILKSYVHYRTNVSTSLVNAFWNGAVMSYGDGNSSTSILTSIDICGHEIGHGICSSTANLAYQNQSGAINEGLSDIWGACIEHYGRTGTLASPFASGVWKIAEDLGSTPFRSMNNPTIYGNPDTYLGTNWTTTGDEGNCTPTSSNDRCGVHNNSGVLNHWFYILTVGKSGTNNAPSPYSYSVSGIGMAKSSQITYYAERDYLTPNATYLDMRTATIQVANNLYCGSSNEVIAVTNAWYAVNVGEQFTTFPIDISLKRIVAQTSITCGATYNSTITFENAGTNAITSLVISYSIDGGAPINLNWTGNLTSCQTIDYTISIGNIARGTHLIEYTTTAVGDGNNDNNTKNSLILVNDAGTVNSINTFELITDNLITYDEGLTDLLWQRGLASGTILNNTVAGGSNVYGTNLSGEYPDNITSYLVSQCYDLTQYQNPIINFDMAFDLENDFDYINVEYSTNGGTTWSILGDATTGTNWYNSSTMPNANNCENCVGAQWTGTGGANAIKTNYSWNMSNFGYGGVAPQSNIIFRFNFVTDPGVTNEGVIIDNFVITGTPVLANTENTFENFSISPNPTNGVVLIKLSSSDEVKVELFDIRGRKCFNNTYPNSSTLFNQEINLGQLEKGIYLLNVTSEEKTATKKVIIQ